MKKIIILKHNNGRLGNQLWNYISVYAFCLEKKYLCLNYSFFKYDKYFNIKDKNLLYRSFLWCYRLSRLVKLNGFMERIYNRCVSLIIKFRPQKIVNSGGENSNNGIFYLPPTPAGPAADLSAMEKITSNEKMYFNYQAGWPFRNPVGIEKYREQIKKYFLPKLAIRQPAEKLINSLKGRYGHIVGVHLRQGDYKNRFMDGELYFTENQIAEILKQYLANFNRTAAETCFIICSDGPINRSAFENLNIALAPGEVMTDLHLLALTDIIIGSDSTFGSFASYYGNIPHIVFTKPEIDWPYYKNKNNYFINKYSTVTKLN